MRERDRIILSVVGAVIVVGGFWMLALSPKLKQSKALSADIAKQQGELSKTKQEAKPVKHAQVNYAATYATLARLGKAVPVAGSVDDDVPSLILQLNQGGKVTRTGFASLEVNSAGGDGGAASPASAPTPSQQGSSGPGSAATGAADAGSAGAAATVALNKTGYKYKYLGTLYDLENLMHYLTDMVDVDAQRLKISGRLLAIESIDFTVVGAGSNPLMQTEISIDSYTVPEGSVDLTGGGAAAAAGADASQAASAGSGSTSADQVPGAPPQAQPATPPSASVRRP